jgi:hypothetical protein
MHAKSIRISLLDVEALQQVENQKSTEGYSDRSLDVEVIQQVENQKSTEGYSDRSQRAQDDQ